MPWLESDQLMQDNQMTIKEHYEKHATRDERGRRVLNIDKIADNEDRTRFQRLITQAEP